MNFNQYGQYSIYFENKPTFEKKQDGHHQVAMRRILIDAAAVIGMVDAASTPEQLKCQTECRAKYPQGVLFPANAECPIYVECVVACGGFKDFATKHKSTSGGVLC